MNCWVAGWRNFGVTTGNKQCPEGAHARGQQDGHKPASGDMTEKECCQKTCWEVGWYVYFSLK